MKFLKFSYTYTDPNHEPAGGTPKTDYPKSSFLYAGTVGTKYYFSNNVAAFIEAGYGIAYLTAGMSIKVF